MKGQSSPVHANGFTPPREAIIQAIKRFAPPLYLYDERGIRASARTLNEAFAWAPGYRNYFAVKALPNPRILEILRDEQSGADTSSGPELALAERAGITGSRVMFTSNDTPAEEFRRAAALGAIINFDDLTHIGYYREHLGNLPETACVRYNPGRLKGGNEMIGLPEEAKFGMTATQLPEAYRQLKAGGVQRFGMHTMVASNEVRADYFAETARILFAEAQRVMKETGVTLSFINLGGGFGIPYEPGQQPIDVGRVTELIKSAYREAFGTEGPEIFTEMGRFVVGPHGVLLATVRHVMQKHRQVVGVDATMADLMRPSLYGAYHHITVLGKEDAPATETYDVAGSLCENNDKFAIQRKLPKVVPGDVLVIHDTGAHGRAMGFNYNGKLRCGEALLREDGSLELIRRAETEDDLFATLDVSHA